MLLVSNRLRGLFFQTSASVILILLVTKPQTRPKIIIIAKILQEKKNNRVESGTLEELGGELE